MQAEEYLEMHATADTLPPGVEIRDDRTAASQVSLQLEAPLPLPGTRVIVVTQKANLLGTVRFAGLTSFAAGSWIGTELDAPSGKNDGSVLGTRYFECLPLHGLFARPDMVKVVSSPKPGTGLKRKSKSRFGESRKQITEAYAGGLRLEADAELTEHRQLLLDEKSLRLQQRQAKLETQRQALSECHVILDVLRKENENLRCQAEELSSAKLLITSLQQDNGKLRMENMQLSAC